MWKFLQAAVCAGLLTVCGCSAINSVRLDSVRVGVGRTEGRVHDGRYAATVIVPQTRLDVSDLVPLPVGRVIGIVEPFAGYIEEPRRGVEAGLCAMARYEVDVHGITPYVEGGAGPMYLGIDTREQGKAGFNFMNQIGAGVRLSIDDNMSLEAGYQYRHISHAGLRDSQNHGIETHMGIVGFAWKF